jgi:hypothetical protein
VRPTLRCRFRISQTHSLAGRFSDASGDELVERIGSAARQQGFLTREEFLSMARWKTPRSQPRCAKNSPEFVEEVTRNALASKNERFKIECLRLLEGVEWPTASVILHFCDEAPYPILDVRALWSLGLSRAPHYTLAFWLEYLRVTRALAAKAGVSMRTLDRALWQYSKERQPAA